MKNWILLFSCLIAFSFCACTSNTASPDAAATKQKVERIEKAQDTAKKAAEKVEAETNKAAEEIEDLLKDI